MLFYLNKVDHYELLSDNNIILHLCKYIKIQFVLHILFISQPNAVFLNNFMYIFLIYKKPS